MTDPTRLFYSELDPARAERVVADVLAGTDDGELYMQHTVAESFSFDDGRMKSASFDTTQGFGLRGVSGETTAFAHANEISEAAIRRAGETVALVRGGHGGTIAAPPARTNRKLYVDDDPISAIPFARKVALLERIDAAARTYAVRPADVLSLLSSPSKSLTLAWPVADRAIRWAGRSRSRSSRSSDSARCAPRLVPATAWTSSMMIVSTPRSVSRAWLVSIRKRDSGVVMRMSGGVVPSLRRSAGLVSPERSPTVTSPKLSESKA